MTEKPRYAWARFNHRYCVYDDRVKENVSAWDSEHGAIRECERLNLNEWRSARPVSALSEPLVFEDTGELEERLLWILDKCWNVELRAAA